MFGVSGDVPSACSYRRAGSTVFLLQNTAAFWLLEGPYPASPQRQRTCVHPDLPRTASLYEPHSHVVVLSRRSFSCLSDHTSSTPLLVLPHRRSSSIDSSGGHRDVGSFVHSSGVPRRRLGVACNANCVSKEPRAEIVSRAVCRRGGVWEQNANGVLAERRPRRPEGSSAITGLLPRPLPYMASASTRKVIEMVALTTVANIMLYTLNIGITTTFVHGIGGVTVNLLAPTCILAGRTISSYRSAWRS
ncbi:hypothetical protein BC628DRAFT_833724 [Trametes gibbosa]|nr:hypothetical protein BC628DRAFT_833724 [Trametes gibbosa]